MMGQPKRHVSVLINAISIIVIALLTTLLPGYGLLIFLVFYMLVLFIVYRFTMKTGKMPPPSELGTPLYKESNAMKVAVSDPGLNKDLGQQFKFLMVTIAISILAIFLYSLYNGLAGVELAAYLLTVTGSKLLSNFLNYVTMYTLIFVILYSLRWAVTRRMTYVNLIIPYSFAVYRKGIVINNKNFIALDYNLCFTLNKQRRFVELLDPRSKTSRIRLYTETPTALYERLVEVGFNECKA